jgi:hypothetical protein
MNNAPSIDPDRELSALDALNGGLAVASFVP